MVKQTGRALFRSSPLDTGSSLASHRFPVLDGLRGVAALIVVLLHTFDNSIIPNGQLAVDLFFILSGFVIAHSYGDRILLPKGRRQFLISRFIRLYPMLLVGAVGGVGLALLHNSINAADPYDLKVVAITAALSFIVLPYLGADAVNVFSFSLNPPMWSLFFEIFANVLYLAVAKFLTVRTLCILTFVGIIGVVFMGPLGGGLRTNFLAGFPRVVAGFFAGVLLRELWKVGRLPKFQANIFVLSASLLALAMIPFEIGGWLYVPILGVLLLIVIGGINCRPANYHKWFAFLGLVSYPVYLIHWFTIYAMQFIAKQSEFLRHHYSEPALLHLIAIVFIGYAIGAYYETPVMDALKRLSRRRRHHAH